MLRDQDFTASDVSTPATTETLNTYRDAIDRFERNDWTYIPMPEDGKYFNIKNQEKPQDIQDDQFVQPGLHLLEVMEKLVEHPFLLVEKDGEHEIINLSNLNKREVKDFLYPLLSELAEELAYRIEDYYEDSEHMFGMVSEFTLGTWFKARQDDVELHIAEFLTLSNMIGVIKGHRPLMDSCGFDDNDDVDELNGVEDLRNKVMHGNRTLVDDTETLKKHLDRISRAQKTVHRLS